jgi:L-alanine-DL-glutamate epimerase-like enolase superfamily enzyme
MRITHVRATTHRVPVAVPLLPAPLVRELVVVRVETDAGLAGHGVTGPTQRRAVRALVNEEMAPLLVGRDPLPTERHWHDLLARLNPRAQTGAWSSAVSAVDIALWDLKGKALGQPVWRLLGGARERVPVYATCGLLEYDREQVVEAARRHVAAGHRRLKVVVAARGGEAPAEDAARVAAVREAVGPDVELMVDANCLFTLPRALELCARLEPLGITWFEEPVAGNDARLLADLRRQTRIPIAAGQNEGHKWRHRELIVQGAVDVVQPNVVWGGGYTEGLKVAALAQAFHLPVANGGGWPHHNMHLIAAVANGWLVEFHVPMVAMAEVVFRDPPRAVGGVVALPEAPGLGLEPDEGVLRDTLEP